MKILFPRLSVPQKPEARQRMVTLWHRALDTGAYPEHVFHEALDVLARDATANDSPPTPGDLLRACRKAIERIERDPVRREKLYEWRLRRRDELIARDRQNAAKNEP
ncbi:hypothetical protein [Corynebacterium sp. HMSC08A12]|uniref:hypothetical protein n=1 Tax=Corynebacterium sp. HMSC08A12 TaxID=1581134 RepID=UPI001AEFBBDD|nr:hypothetical protein [Corynebacterium sp. HMSC08A12]